MRDKVANLAINYSDARVDLIIPRYMSASSTIDLQTQKDAFGDRVVDIGTSAKVMIRAGEMIK